MSSLTRFEAIRFGELPPFAPQTVVFPANESKGLAEVHLLVGENGTGKTRLLCALASCCGNDEPLASRIGAVDTQRAESELSVLVSCLSDSNSNGSSIWERPDQWFPGEWDHTSFAERETQRVAQPQQNRTKSFGSGASTRAIDLAGSEKKPPKIIAFSYNGAGTIRDAKVAALATPGEKVGHKKLWVPARLLNFSAPASIAEESEIVLQTIANIETFSALEAKNNGSQFNTLISKRMETVLTDLTGKKFYFELRTVPEFSIRVNWGGASMTINQLPDGMRSILAWLGTTVARLRMIFPDEHHDSLSESFILLVDEPETHLHPAWQRKLLPAAQRLFPNAQIFVATHSPFVISSVNHGWIHVFRENASGHVEIEKARPCSSGDTWIDSVEDVLGLREWYDPETEEMLRQFRETRDSVTSAGVPVEELQTLADQIAPRSETLRALMGKEMTQARRLVAARGAKG